jgi:hypothetical protein
MAGTPPGRPAKAGRPGAAMTERWEIAKSLRKDMLGMSA